MKKLAIVATVIASTLVLPAYADTNVALNGNVEIDGTGFGTWSSLWGNGTLSSLATVTDGAFLPDGQQWNSNTVFWNGTAGGDTNNFIVISLASRSNVNQLTLQADNNDDYLIQFRNSSQQWQDLATISPHRSWGMDKGYATLGTPIQTDAFRIRSIGGDGYYSVSEFQAMGNVVAVPEPETYGMMLAGLSVLGVIARRRTRVSA